MPRKKESAVEIAAMRRELYSGNQSKTILPESGDNGRDSVSTRPFQIRVQRLAIQITTPGRLVGKASKDNEAYR